MSGGPIPSSATEPPHVTYRLGIVVPRRLIVAVGCLGDCAFPAGRYAYVGSARRHLAARLRRHLGDGRARLHWHIDYLLSQPGVRIDRIETFVTPECEQVAATGGRVVIPGFGASDCRHACGSHLRYFGRRRQP